MPLIYKNIRTFRNLFEMFLLQLSDSLIVDDGYWVCPADISPALRAHWPQQHRTAVSAGPVMKQLTM